MDWQYDNPLQSSPPSHEGPSGIRAPPRTPLPLTPLEPPAPALLAPPDERSCAPLVTGRGGAVTNGALVHAPRTALQVGHVAAVPGLAISTARRALTLIIAAAASAAPELRRRGRIGPRHDMKAATT